MKMNKTLYLNSAFETKSLQKGSQNLRLQVMQTPL